MEMPTFANFLGTLALISYVITLAPTNIRIVFPLLIKNKLITFSLKYRRQIGVSAFILAFIHGGLFVIKRRVDLADSSTYWIYIQGISILTIFTLLAITSNDWSVKNLKKNWKRLHQLTYLAMFLLVWHIGDKMLGHWTYLTSFNILVVIIAIVLFLKRRSIEYNKYNKQTQSSIVNSKSSNVTLLLLKNPQYLLFKQIIANSPFIFPSAFLTILIGSAGVGVAMQDSNLFKIRSEISTTTSEAGQENQPLRTLTRHSAWVYCVAISPNGQTIASGSYDKTIKIWNRQTGEVNTLIGHENAISSLAISSDGKFLVSGSWDRKIDLWNFETRELIRTFKGHSDDVESVAISPNNQTIVSGSYDKTIKIWNLQTGELIRTLNSSDNVRSVVISPDGHTVASSSGDGNIMIWQLNTGDLKIPLAAHKKAVTSVAFSPDGKTLASSSEDGTVKLWNMQTGQLNYTLDGGHGAILSVAFSPDSQTLASSGYDREIKLWNTQTGELLRDLSSHNKAVWSVAFSTKDNILASGSADKTIKIWSVSPSKSQTNLSPEELEAPLTTQPEITNLSQVSALNSILYNQINQGWEKRVISNHDLVYRVGVARDGAIIGYKAIDSAIDNSVEQSQLSELLYKLVSRRVKSQEPIGHFKVVFTRQGILQVSPWWGYRGKA